MEQNRIGKKSEANSAFRRWHLRYCYEVNMFKLTLIVLVVLLSNTSVVWGLDYTGSYIFSGNGNQVALTLSQESGSLFTGTLKSTTGMNYEIDAEIENGKLVGACFNNEGEVGMEAILSGSKLTLTLVELNAFFQPDYSSAKKIVLVKTSSLEGQKTWTSQENHGKMDSISPKVDNTTQKYSAPINSEKTPQATASLQEISDENWGYKFKIPEGWKYRKDHRGAIVGHDTIAGVILVLNLQATDMKDISDQMHHGLHDADIQLSLAGPLKTISQNAMSGVYGGFSSGQQVKAHSTGTLSPYGGVTYVIAIATPDKYSNKLTSAADVITENLQFVKVDVSNLMGHFSGTWTHVSTNRTDWMTFAPDGTYSNTHEAQFSGQEGDNWGNTQNWDVYGRRKKNARWVVRGTKRQGVIIISHPDGAQEEFEYSVYVEKGNTYWQEYLFNGYHYQKK